MKVVRGTPVINSFIAFGERSFFFWGGGRHLECYLIKIHLDPVIITSLIVFNGSIYVPLITLF